MPELVTECGRKILLDEGELKKAKKYKWKLKDKYPITKVDGKKVTLSKLIFEITDNQAVYHKNKGKTEIWSQNITVCGRVMKQAASKVGSTNHQIQKKLSDRFI